MTLAAVLIVKDEEACIRRCIEALRGVDEIVCAVDDRTKDATVEILKEMQGEFPIHGGWLEWHDDFARARNEALDMARADWRLSIDADETLNPGSLDLLRNSIATANGRTLKMPLIAQGSGLTHRSVRCFLRGVKWVGAIHEAPDADDKEQTEASITYGSSPAHLLDPDRNIRLLAKAHAQEPTNARTLYYLAREHWYRNEYQKALPLFGECVKLSKFRAERADAHLYMARILWSWSLGDRARNHCLLALCVNANFREAHRLMAEMSFPRNAAAWNRFAELATNEDVLFVRE